MTISGVLSTGVRFQHAVSGGAGLGGAGLQVPFGLRQYEVVEFDGGGSANHFGWPWCIRPVGW
jgi:hypothetical protein